MNILAAKEVPILTVAAQLGLDEPRRGMIRCVSTSHRDSTPSLSLKCPGNRFKCFGCGLRGDVIDLVQIVMGFDLRTATDWLYADPVLRAAPPIPIRQSIEHTPRLADVILLRAFWEACDASGDWLAHKGLDAGRFGVRRITEAAHDLIPDFPVGWLFVPYYQHGEITYGRARNPNIRRGQNGLTFGFGPRFIGLANTDVIFYNQDALNRVEAGTTLYLAEGETDTMTLDQRGYIAIGFPGAGNTQLFNTLLRYLSICSEKVCALRSAFDNDAAGLTLHEKLLQLKLDIPVDRFDLGQYKDVNDWHLDHLK